MYTNENNEDVETIRSKFPSNEPIYIVLIIIAILSTIGFAVLTILAILKRNHNNKDLFIFSNNFLIVNLIYSLASILNFSFEYNNKNYIYYNSNFLCMSQAFLLLFCSFSRDLWILFITIIKYITIVGQKNIFDNYRFYFFPFCVIGYGVPLLGMLFFYFQGKIGVAELDCWFIKIDKDDHSSKWYGTAFYIAKNIILAAVLILCIIIIRYLSKTLKLSSRENKKEAFKFGAKTLAFPLIQILFAIVPLIYMILLDFVTKSEILGILTLILASAHGVIFPLIYLFTSDLLKAQTENENELMKAITIDVDE